jgi:hypothetical protein
VHAASFCFIHGCLGSSICVKETDPIIAKAKMLRLFSSVEKQSIPSRQPLDEAKLISSSFLSWPFGFFSLGFLVILFTVIVPRIKKFVP